MKNIAIIGAGQLGSRHLQALAFVNEPISIQVIDRSADALNIAENRFNENRKTFHGQISYHTDISNLVKNIDVAIIATGSSGRKKIIEQLLSHSSVRYLILEKFLFTKESD